MATIKCFVVHADAADAATIGHVLHLLAAAVAAPDTPAHVVEALPAAPAPRQVLEAGPQERRRPGRKGQHDEAVLKALRFREGTLGEVATAVAGRRGDAVTLQRALWPVLRRLVKRGQVVRTGKSYALATGR